MELVKKKRLMICLAVSTQYRRVTDEQRAEDIFRHYRTVKTAKNAQIFDHYSVISRKRYNIRRHSFNGSL